MSLICISLSLCRWLKDGVPVRQGEGVRITSNGRRLVISRAQVSDTALFHCVATNEAGEQEREFKVSVHGNDENRFLFNICHFFSNILFDFYLTCSQRGRSKVTFQFSLSTKKVTGTFMVKFQCFISLKFVCQSPQLSVLLVQLRGQWSSTHQSAFSV